MSNGFAVALASQDHLRYFKAQKPSEGKRFHELDSQSHIEKHQKPTDLTALYQHLVYKSARKRRHSTDIISSTSDLPTKKQASQLTVH